MTVTPLDSTETTPGKHLGEELGEELDRIRSEVIAARGADDARYIRTVIATQRGLEAGGRTALAVSLFPPAWVAGTAMLSIRPPGSGTSSPPPRHGNTPTTTCITPGPTSSTATGTSDTSSSGCADQRWRPRHLAQPLYNLVLAPLFEWGIALYDLEPDAVAAGRKTWRSFAADLSGFLSKATRQLAKDYVLFPLLAGPSALPCLLGNLTANTVRNLWANTIIFCGHFPGDVQTFTEEHIEGETRGQWYLRQIQGSANIEGGPLFHVLSGNLGHQIEHHAFPDLPSNSYAEIAPRVRELCEKYGIPYVTGPLWRQYGSTWGRILRFAIPGK
ncbi:fatty acid desaturase [Streptomyces spectabilis]|uniref:Linoleoyl-CoA desaturase n=1 Tax=Streptomyces spectabilis TaxID=68270 RepID=A0A7W8AVY5_STRST|nr:linoleoyl-CoA desaturase [Streptomyces spectabilis]GGV22844.1 fatty acid desaturase [Streptomyces spectabilis]